MVTSIKEQLVTRNLKLETRNTNSLTSLEIQVRALNIGYGLTSTEAPNDMTSWYCKAYKVLGEGRYQMCASAAKQPGVKKPSSLFGWLLKQEMAQRA